MAPMTKHELRVAELKKVALRMRGVWWWSDEDDNPFGVALLVCPHPPEGRGTHVRNAYAELYTVGEVEGGREANFTARDDKRQPYSRVGWTIFDGDKATMWTLPVRFEYDNLMPEIERRLSISKKLKRIAKERLLDRNTRNAKLNQTTRYNRIVKKLT